MRALITKVEEKPSKFGGVFYYCFLKSDKGKSYKTCLYPNFRNFGRWKSVIEKARQEEVWLTGLIERNGLVDADSPFYLAKGVSENEHRSI